MEQSRHGVDIKDWAGANLDEVAYCAGRQMRIIVALASVPLLLGSPEGRADTGMRAQYPRPPVAPPIPRSQPAPVWTMPFPACDRIPQPPRYPALALTRGEQGEVTMRLFVADTGRIREAQVYRSSGSAQLDDAAVASTRSWTLEPGRQDTRPTAMWSEVVVSFRILAGDPVSTKVEIRFPNAADINRCLA